MEGNQQKMREALLNIQEYAAAMDVDDGNVLAILDACRDALAAPPRQCDVGTPDEQGERFTAFCDAFFTAVLPMEDMEEDAKNEMECSSCCYRCPLNNKGEPCALAWAQTPYEQEGAEQ